MGEITEDLRDQFYIATKVRTEGKEAGEAQIARSFELLKTDYIDLFQVHNMIDWQTHLPTLERLRGEGKIGMVGVSAMVPDAYPTIMDLMRQRRVDAVQIPYNVLNRSVEDELLPLAEELGTGVLVMEPLQKGRYVLELKQQPDLTPLRDYGINTWAQALLAWVISDRRVSSAIPTTSRPERIQENAQAAAAAELPQPFRGLHPFRGGAVSLNGGASERQPSGDVLEGKGLAGDSPSPGSRSTGTTEQSPPPAPGWLVPERRLKDATERQSRPGNRRGPRVGPLHGLGLRSRGSGRRRRSPHSLGAGCRGPGNSLPRPPGPHGQR